MHDMSANNTTDPLNGHGARMGNVRLTFLSMFEDIPCACQSFKRSIHRILSNVKKLNQFFVRAFKLSVPCKTYPNREISPAVRHRKSTSDMTAFPG